jgi:hypothetical protein
LGDHILVLREGRPTALLKKNEFSPDLIMDYSSPGGAVQLVFQRVVGNVPEAESVARITAGRRAGV